MFHMLMHVCDCWQQCEGESCEASAPIPEALIVKTGTQHRSQKHKSHQRRELYTYTVEATYKGRLYKGTAAYKGTL